jgi:hypothetical protein
MWLHLEIPDDNAGGAAEFERWFNSAERQESSPGDVVVLIHQTGQMLTPVTALPPKLAAKVLGVDLADERCWF